LATGIGKIKIHDEPHPYSFDQKDAYFTKQYCKRHINYCEIDFFAGAIFPEACFRVGLANEGNGMRYQKATPEMFAETGRLKRDMGKNWHRDDARVVGHDNTV